MEKIVFASNNQGKSREIAEIFSVYNLNVISQTAFNVTEVEETGLTFIENAIIKARHASQTTGLPALADDSGLEVDALKGEPGIYSARYAGLSSNDKANCEKLIAQLKKMNEPPYTARFRCALVLMRYPNDPAPFISQGIWEGEVIFEPTGQNGFGYDPIFYLPELKCTAAELSLKEKNSMSHRAKALNQLIQQLNAYRKIG